MLEFGFGYKGGGGGGVKVKEGCCVVFVEVVEVVVVLGFDGEVEEDFGVGLFVWGGDEFEVGEEGVGLFLGGVVNKIYIRDVWGKYILFFLLMVFWEKVLMRVLILVLFLRLR